MKVLWSRCTSHLFEPPWMNDQGIIVQTTFYDHFSKSFVGRQGGRQFFLGGPAHLGRKAVRYFCLEAQCKGKCVEPKLRGCCYSHLLFRSMYQSFGDQKFLSKMDLGQTSKSNCSSQRKIKVQGCSQKQPYCRDIFLLNLLQLEWAKMDFGCRSYRKNKFWLCPLKRRQIIKKWPKRLYEEKLQQKRVQEVDLSGKGKRPRISNLRYIMSEIGLCSIAGPRAMQL